MANQSNEELVRKLYSSYEGKRVDEQLSLFDDKSEFKLMSMPDKPIRGKKEIRDFLQSWTTSFPDMKAEIVKIFSSGDVVVVESINRGTNEGPIEGPKRKLQATHRKVQVPSCDLFRFSNGKIVSWTCYWQGDLMMDQLGIHPSAQAAA